MKILLATDYFMPALGYEAGLAEAYMTLGHDVLHSASRKIPSEKSGLETGAATSAIPHRLHSVLRIGSRLILIPGIAVDIARFRPDLVHAHNFLDLTSVMLAILKPFFRYKLVYSCHASHVNTDTGSSIWRRSAYCIWRAIGGRLIRNLADEVNAVGENEQELTSWAIGRDSSEVRIVRLGADLSVFSKRQVDREALRRQLGLGEHDVTLIHVGTLAKRKEAELLVHAAAELRKQGHPVSALIVGGGESAYISSLKQTIERLGAADFSKLIDRFESRDTIADYYAISDIAVWPATISIAVVEAMASGLPLVLKTGDPYRDFLVSGDNGLLYSAGDPASLVDCLSCLIEDENLRKRLGSNGREFAEREFEWLSIANSLVSRMA